MYRRTKTLCLRHDLIVADSTDAPTRVNRHVVRPHERPHLSMMVSNIRTIWVLQLMPRQHCSTASPSRCEPTDPCSPSRHNRALNTYMYIHHLPSKLVQGRRRFLTSPPATSAPHAGCLFLARSMARSSRTGYPSVDLPSSFILIVL